MVKINENFKFERDAYQWILTETYMGRDKKTGEPKAQTRKSFHGTLQQVCKYILDRGVKDCQSLEEIIEKIDKAVELMTKQAEIIIDGSNDAEEPL